MLQIFLTSFKSSPEQKNFALRDKKNISLLKKKLDLYILWGEYYAVVS